MEKDEEQQCSILYMINLFGNQVYGRTFFQKFFYLIREECNIQFFEDYSPHYYGPFSRELNACVTDMVAMGFLDEEKVDTKGHDCYVYSLTNKGKNHLASNEGNLNSNIKKCLEQYHDKFGKFTATDLLRYVYKQYPRSAVNSIYKGS